MPECFVAKASELKDGDRRIVISGQHEVGVFFKDGDYYAYSNYCVHAGGPACEGILVNNVVDILNAVLTDGLPAVEAACTEALGHGVHSADVVLNILARQREYDRRRREEAA